MLFSITDFPLWYLSTFSTVELY